MARSIFGTVGLAATLAFAIPVAYIGVDFLFQGKSNLGLLFLGIAVLMIGIEEYLTTPMDVPGMVAGKMLGSAVKEPDEGTDPGSDAAEASEATPPETGGQTGGDEDGGDEVLIPDAEEKRL
jgi:hypothetical protein